MQLTIHRAGENYVLMASFLHPDGQREIYSALVPRDSEPPVLADLLTSLAGKIASGDGKL